MMRELGGERAVVAGLLGSIDMHKQQHLFWLVGTVLLISFFYVLPRWADWSQNSRLDLVRALSEQGRVSIDGYVANTGDYAVFNGHAYSDKAPGPAMLAFPFALALRPVFELPLVQAQSERLAGGAAFNDSLNPNGTGMNDAKLRAFVLLVVVTAITMALPTVLGALALLGLLLRQSFAPAVAAMVALAYGLATGVTPYANNFYSHALIASLLLGAFVLATLPWSPVRATLIGMLLGWAVISEYPAVLPGTLIGLVAVWQWRRPYAFGWLALGALPPGMLLAAYDWAAFGTLLPVGYEHSALWQQQHQTGFLSITWPHAEAVWGLTFGLFRGLFVRAPWLLLAVPGLVLWWRAGRLRPLWWAALIAPLIVLLFYASSVMWWGGFAAGPRYLVACAPFLALASAPAVQALWSRRWGQIMALGLVVLSLLLTWSELLAGQGFPPDTIRNPWLDYTAPAWAAGDIARNLGTALRLHGAFALIPLAILIIAAFVIACREPSNDDAFETVEGQAIASLQN